MQAETEDDEAVVFSMLAAVIRMIAWKSSNRERALGIGRDDSIVQSVAFGVRKPGMKYHGIIKCGKDYLSALIL